MNQQEEYRDFIKIISMLLLGLIAIGIIFSTSSCTISFQNISTHGTATDLVDENQSAEPDVKVDLTIPVKAI